MVEGEDDIDAVDESIGDEDSSVEELAEYDIDDEADSMGVALADEQEDADKLLENNDDMEACVETLADGDRLAGMESAGVAERVDI